MSVNLFKGSLGLGHLRNKICPICDSGKKFKKCECYQRQLSLISEITKPPRIKVVDEAARQTAEEGDKTSSTNTLSIEDDEHNIYDSEGNSRFEEDSCKDSSDEY